MFGMPNAKKLTLGTSKSMLKLLSICNNEIMYGLRLLSSNEELFFFFLRRFFKETYTEIYQKGTKLMNKVIN